MQSALLALTFLSRIELKGKEQFGKIYRHFQSCVAFDAIDYLLQGMISYKAYNRYKSIVYSYT